MLHDYILYATMNNGSFKRWDITAEPDSPELVRTINESFGADVVDVKLYDVTDYSDDLIAHWVA